MSFPEAPLQWIFASVVIDWTKYNLKEAKKIAGKSGKATALQMMFNIQALDLVDRGILLNSIKAGVRTKHGFVDRIQFTYEFYGRIHETGAEDAFGKGVKLPPLQWRSLAIEAHMGTLNEEFAEFYADLIAEEIQIDDAKMKM